MRRAQVSNVVKLGKISIFSMFSFFYLIAGTVLLAILVQSSSGPVHVGLLGALSLIVSYGLNRMKKWALFLTVLTALPSISFGCVTIYAVYVVFGSGMTEILLLSAMIIYVVLSASSSLYVIRRRDEFT